VPPLPCCVGLPALPADPLLHPSVQQSAPSPPLVTSSALCTTCRAVLLCAAPAAPAVAATCGSKVTARSATVTSCRYVHVITTGTLTGQPGLKRRPTWLCSGYGRMCVTLRSRRNAGEQQSRTTQKGSTARHSMIWHGPCGLPQGINWWRSKHELLY
jgi:hypothetical protein